MKILCALILLAALYGDAWGQFSVTEISILKSLTNRDCVNNESPVWVFATQRWSCGPTGGVGDVTEVQGTSPISVSSGTGPVPVVSIVTNPTLPGTTTGTFSGALTGNASTATALAANPTDCAAGAYAKSIAASGNLGCDILIVYASVDPTVNDDTGDGIIKGTKWHNDQGDADPTNDTIWEAVSITAADALWVQIYPAPGSVTPTLSSVLAAGNSYFGATSPSTGLILGEDANNYGVIYWDLSTGGPKLICVVAGVPRNCNIEYTLNAGYSFKLNDSAGAPAFEYKEGVGVTRLIPGTIAQGDIYFHDGTKITRLAPGSAGECLKSQGAGANPQWTTC